MALHIKFMALHAKHQQTLLLILFLFPLSEQVFLMAAALGPRGAGPSAAADLPRDLHMSKSLSEVFWSKILYSLLLFINLY